MKLDKKYGKLKPNVTNPYVFIPVLDMLLSKLLAEAASTMNRCAFGMSVDSLFRKIYAQAECTRDISTDICRTCLSNTVNDILALYPGIEGLEGFMGSCIVRYDIDIFFNLTALPPGPPNQITPSIKHNSPHINPSIILGAVSGFLVLFVCLFATWRRLMSAIYEGPNEGIADDDTIR